MMNQNQQLTAKELAQVTGGSATDKGVKPASKTLTTDDLKKVTGGSGIDKGVHPAAAKLVMPVEDTQLVSASLDDDKDKQLP